MMCRKSFARIVICSFLLCAFSSDLLAQTTYYWEAGPANDGTLVGGPGTWNTTNAFFTTSSTDNGTAAAWATGSGTLIQNSVVFGGTTGGNVVLSPFTAYNPLGSGSATTTDLLLNNLTFATSGYTLSGTAIRFIYNGATNGTITVNSGVTATISNSMAGNSTGGLTAGTANGNISSNVVINGGGQLNLGGGNNNMGFTVDGGTTVQVTGGSYSGFNLNTIDNGSTVRTTANGVLSVPSSFRTTAGAGTLDLGNTTQSISTLGGALAVTNANANGVLGLTLVTNALTHTGAISNGTGKLSIATTGTVAQGPGFSNTNTFATQTFAGTNTYTGFTSLGRGSVVLDFSNAAAPASNILYNSGFGTPTGDDGKLIIARPLATVSVANAAVGSFATLTLTGKASTDNSQQFSGLKLTGGAANVFINPNATANNVTLNLGGSFERSAGSLINFATTNATTTLSANASILSSAGTASGVLKDANGVAFAVIGGRDWAAKNDSNTRVVTAATAGAGNTSIFTSSTSTAFTANADIAIPVAGGAANDVRLSANTTISTLKYGDTTRSGVNLGGTTLTTGGILLSQANGSSGNFIANGTITSPGASGSDIVLYSNTANYFGLNTVLANGAAATGFTKGGSGFVLQNANNTFTGTLAVTEGGLVVRGTNTASGINILGSQTNLMGQNLPAGGINTAGTYLQLGNADSSGSLGTGSVNLGVNALLGIKRTDAFTLVNNTLGAGGLSQGWSGTTTLTQETAAKYNHVGDTAITAGTLRLDYTNAGSGIISNNSRLVLGGGTLESTASAANAHNEIIRDWALLPGASTVTRSGSFTGITQLGSLADGSVAGSTVLFTAPSIANTSSGNTNNILGTRARFIVGSAGNYDWAVGGGNITALASGSYSAVLSGAVATANVGLVDGGVTTALAASQTINTLKLANSSASLQTVDIGTTNTLTLSAGGLLVTGNDSVVIQNGTLRSNSATNSDLIVHQYNNGGLTISSVISNGTGTSTLTKSGSGTLTLGGLNTYTGQSFLSGGVTSISQNANLGAAASGGQITMNNATLRSTSSVILANGAVGTNNRNVVLNGIGGTFDVVNLADTLTIGGTVTGSGGLTKIGAGTLALNNTTNSYAGPTTVSAGTLRFNATANLTRSNVTVESGATIDQANGGNFIGSLAGAGTVTNTGAAATLVIGTMHSDTTFSGQLTNATNALSIDKMGAGTLTLTGGTNNYTGSTTISGGTLALSGSGALPTATAVNVSSAAGTFDISGVTASGVSIGSLAGARASQVILGSKVLTIAGSGNSTFTGDISGTGGLTIARSAAANQTLNGNNSYDGVTTITAGTIVAGSNSALGSTVGNTVINSNGNTTLGGILIVGTASSGGVTINENITLQGPGDGAANLTSPGVPSPQFSSAIAGAGGVTSTLNGTVTLTGSASFRLGSQDTNTLFNVGLIQRSTVAGGTLVLSPGANSTISVNTAIDNNGGGLTAHGGGKAVLTASNNDIGAVMIQNATTLQTTASNALALNQSVTMGQGALVNTSTSLNNDVATFIFDGTTQTIGHLNGFANAGVTPNNATATNNRLITSTTATAKTLIVGNGNGTGGFDGVISNGTGGGTTAFTKVGTGTQSFFGTVANTYTGDTTVSGGSLVLAKTAGINAVSGNLVIGDGTGNDIVQLTNSNQIADTSLVSFNGTVANAGILRLNNQSETISGLSSTGGAGIVENNNAAAGTSLLTSNVVSGSTVFSGILRDNAGAGSGVLAFTKDGAGTQVFTGGSSFSGPTIVNAGTLLASNATGSALGGSNVTVEAAGTFGGTGSITGTVALNGGVLSPGASIESLTIGGLSGTGSLLIEYDGSAGQQIDFLDVAGNIDATGITLNFASLGAALADPFYVFAKYSGTLTGAFAAINSQPAGYLIDYDYLGNKEIALVTAVPEPGTIALLVMAGIGGGLYRRSRNSKKDSGKA